MFLIVVLPYCIVYLTGLPMWLGRTLAIGVCVGITTVGSFWIALNPRTGTLVSGAKFDQSGHEHPEGWFSRIIRCLPFLFGLFVAYYLTIPYIQDVYHLVRKGSPSIIVSQIEKVGQSRRSRVIREAVRLAKDDETYSLMFSLEPGLRQGRNYEFWVLPHSRMIVSYRQV